MKNEIVLVLDFGGQYNQLIARRVREHKIYCEVKSYKTPIEEIKAMNPSGIIFTGGPNSVYLDSIVSACNDLACYLDRCAYSWLFIVAVAFFNDYLNVFQ